MHPLSGGIKRPSSETEERSAKRSALQTTLETVPDDLDDATHALLDIGVFETCIDPVENISSALVLLSDIISNSQGRLNQTYCRTRDAKALIEEHPELMDKLKEAWNNKSFKQIRNLKILRIRQSFHPALGVPIEQSRQPSVPVPSFANIPFIKSPGLGNAVIDAWNLEYHGTAHKVLLEAVDEVYAMPRERQYARIVHVTQSSGTGKSRTIDKIATERILFPICLREGLTEQYFTYPYPDTAVRNHLLNAPSAKQERECKAYLRSFLCSLFTSAHFQAQKFFAVDARVPYTSIVKQFYDFFGNMSSRNDFYKSVIANVDHQKNSCGDVTQSFKMFKKSVQSCCFDWPVDVCPILISMDEIHVLFDPRVLEGYSGYDLYSRFKSVLSEVVSQAFCVVFLSTAIRVPKVTPPTEVPASMRERDDELLLPAPVTELPFDVHLLSDPLVPGTASLNSVGSFQFTAKFGRPLFYATYLSRNDQNESQGDVVSRIMLTVQEKLSGRRWPPDSPACLDASSIAVLSARLLLDLSPAASSSEQYEEDMVRSHLRMLYSVRQDQQVMVTGSSPEPLIAEASAQIMHALIGPLGNEKAYMNMWDLVVKFVDKGLVPQGTIGQLIGRVLSILAMDRAIHGLTEHRELEYQTPVTVATYYKALLTDEAWESLRQSIPANGAMLSEKSAAVTFEAAFANAYFHFSHYGKANDVTPMQDRLAWALWLRGTAILFQLNQELPDRAIPIFFPDLGGVSPESVSLVLEQDKTGQSPDPRTIGIQSAETLGLFSQGNKLPYIFAVHCYALTEDEGVAVPTASSYSLRHPDEDKEAPRYQINFRGLAAYREVTMSIKGDIQRMIDDSKNALFNHHPRSYGLPTLRKMLPMLSEDLDATLWLGSLESGKDSSQEVGGRRKEKQRTLEEDVSPLLGDDNL